MTAAKSSGSNWRKTLESFWHDFEWPVIGGFAVLALVLGFFGYYAQFRAQGDAHTFWDILYLDIQLFLIQMPEVKGPLNPALNIARFLAPAVAGYTAWQALAKLFADQLQSLKLRLLSDHVVVCGLGRKAFVIAREFRRRGTPVVVIEQDEENDLVRQCRDLGALVLIGDGSEAAMLRCAGVARARSLFALCGDDGVNAEVTVQATGLLTGRESAPLICVAHILDPQLCSLLREREFETRSARHLHLEFFNVFELGARVLLEDQHFDEILASGQPAPHLVVIGLGHLGESLVVAAARQWWLSMDRTGHKLVLTLVDVHAQGIADAMSARHPGLNSACELHVCEMDVRSAEFARARFLPKAQCNGQRPIVFVCLDYDSLSLSTALAIARMGDSAQSTIIVRMTQDAGLATLLHGVPDDRGRFQKLHAFALLDRACQPEQVLRGTRELLARAIHAEYLRLQRAAGDTPDKNSSLRAWDELPDDLREANRQQADDLRAKLDSVGRQIEPMPDWTEPLFAFTPEEIEKLAEREHVRWMEAKLSAGWKHGPKKDSAARTHPCLVPYAELPQSEKEKDRETVRAIPKFLATVGFRVYRMERKAPPT
jgi:hypothetical protein